MTSSIIKHLEDLRVKVAAGNVSVIVGAGFSKNVSSEYLLWSELLWDIVVELHGEKIKRDYESIKHLPNVPDEDTHKKQQVKIYIDEKGYLGIVTDYVKKFRLP